MSHIGAAVFYHAAWRCGGGLASIFSLEELANGGGAA
jgi:hypothetical protein